MKGRDFTAFPSCEITSFASRVANNLQVVAERFGSKATIQTTRRVAPFEVPLGPKQTVELFRTYFGPTNTASEQLDAAGQQALRKELVELWTAQNRANDGGIALDFEFLEVHARPK